MANSKFTAAQKKGILQEMQDGLTTKQASKKYKVTCETLYSWKRQLREEQAAVTNKLEKMEVALQQEEKVAAIAQITDITSLNVESLQRYYSYMQAEEKLYKNKADLAAIEMQNIAKIITSIASKQG